MDVILGKLVRGEIDETEAKRQLRLLTGAEASRFRTEDEMDAVIAQARANPGQYRNVYDPVPRAEPGAIEGGVRGVIPSTEAESARKAYGLLETEAGGPGLLRGEFLRQRFPDVSSGLRERLGRGFGLEDLQYQQLLDMFGREGAQPGFAGMDAPQNTFASFLSRYPQRADPRQLSQQMTNVMGQFERPGAGEEGGKTQFQSTFGEEMTGENVFQAALQPTLAALPPALRNSFLRAMMEELNTRRANPMSLDDPMSVGREMRGRGFFGEGFGGWAR